VVITVLNVAGAWDAARRGLDIGLQDAEEAAALRAAGVQVEAWEQYGIDGGSEYGEADRPMVSIDKISERVPAVLNLESTHKALARFLPTPAFPPPADFGYSAYLSVLTAIDDLTRI
ncbi:hypothetical protein OC845_006691, partial [Tilletia horrida]